MAAMRSPLDLPVELFFKILGHYAAAIHSTLVLKEEDAQASVLPVPPSDDADTLEDWYRMLHM